ncbi:anti-sigma regulatory factor [Granulicella tundricola]|uniref:Putative anti-sigma regulatory factor, serine/threonine protein kinase n=1 Tax=Granulicella tundricola (strain ATCC BAA-1859 / DSM 23138 / MP5ACTX9) TaxID=1198114 RepID=E8X3C8_GRATM|nr:anti-sigma regulatory factor [Granulicella tundricola]ADW70429.1 putative anti-sigma regulatory factor, serine/threonine protein kinase [Granulicella tundricola MP5ACTX9]
MMMDSSRPEVASSLLPIRTPEDIVLVRTAVRKAALGIKFGLVDQTKLVTAASEIARNTLDYGGGGTVAIELLQDPKTGVRLRFEDQGPGIANIDLALTDGWSSGNGMGLGLTGTRRLMDDFDLASKLGEGTTVTITKWSR